MNSFNVFLLNYYINTLYKLLPSRTMSVFKNTLVLECISDFLPCREIFRIRGLSKIIDSVFFSSKDVEKDVVEYILKNLNILVKTKETFMCSAIHNKYIEYYHLCRMLCHSSGSVLCDFPSRKKENGQYSKNISESITLLIKRIEEITGKILMFKMDYVYMINLKEHVSEDMFSQNVEQTPTVSFIIRKWEESRHRLFSREYLYYVYIDRFYQNGFKDVCGIKRESDDISWCGTNVRQMYRGIYEYTNIIKFGGSVHDF